VTQILHKAKIITANKDTIIYNGALLTEGSQILQVGKIEDFGTTFEENISDHGNSLITPGLINLHTHLLYSKLNLIKSEEGLFKWLENLTNASFNMEQNEIEESLLFGINQALSYGTTFVVDNTPSLLSAKLLSKSPLKAVIGLEIFGSDESQAEKIFTKALETLNELEEKYNSQLSFTFSPHAPYDVSLPLWKLLDTWSRKTKKPLLTHLEEAKDEKKWWQEKSGSAISFWQRINKLEPKLKFWKKYHSGVDFLFKNNLLNNNLIAAHLTNATQNELKLIKEANIKCIHCPRSNFNLNNGTANLKLWKENDLLFGIGTDSAASSENLNLIEEIRFAIEEQKLYGLTMSNKEAFELITSNAARVLSMEDVIGTLKKNAFADFLIFDLNGIPECTYKDPLDIIIWKLNIVKDLKEVWINGKKTVRVDSILNKI